MKKKNKIETVVSPEPTIQYKDENLYTLMQVTPEKEQSLTSTLENI